MFDLSLDLSSALPFWPGSCGVNLKPLKRIKAGETDNLSQLECDLHAGTHVDAPWHFIDSGIKIDELSLADLIGPVFVAYLPKTDLVSVEDLEKINLPPNTKRLLLRTKNSELWINGVKEFKKDFVGISPEAAAWIAKKDICLFGIDYLSVQPFNGDPKSHTNLLGAGVIVVEGLNLANIPPGQYELICLPLRLVGAEGSPARVVLIKQGGE